MSTYTLTGTPVDYELLLAEGTLTEDDTFEFVTPEEMRASLTAERTALITKKLYDAFWQGHALGKLDAVPAEAPVPSPRWRKLRFLGQRRFSFPTVLL